MNTKELSGAYHHRFYAQGETTVTGNKYVLKHAFPTLVETAGSDQSAFPAGCGQDAMKFVIWLAENPPAGRSNTPQEVKIEASAGSGMAEPRYYQAILDGANSHSISYRTDWRMHGDPEEARQNRLLWYSAAEFNHEDNGSGGYPHHGGGR